MEQLLFEQDKKECDKISNEDNPFSVFYFACSYKNNQMQEFDKWKAENKWYLHHSGCYKMAGYFVESDKSFSELFTLFEKETSK